MAQGVNGNLDVDGVVEAHEYRINGAELLQVIKEKTEIAIEILRQDMLGAIAQAENDMTLRHGELETRVAQLERESQKYVERQELETALQSVINLSNETTKAINELSERLVALEKNYDPLQV